MSDSSITLMSQRRPPPAVALSHCWVSVVHYHLQTRWAPDGFKRCGVDSYVGGLKAGKQPFTQLSEPRDMLFVARRTTSVTLEMLLLEVVAMANRCHGTTSSFLVMERERLE